MNAFPVMDATTPDIPDPESAVRAGARDDRRPALAVRAIPDLIRNA
jgi:hypothetical protein